MIHIKKIILNPISALLMGLSLGVISRLLDIYTQNLGNIFSEISIWILIGTIVAIYSSTKKKAMINVFLLCAGMLITYYFTAYLTNGVYSSTYIVGWSIFTLLCPVFAWFTWITKENGIFPKLISMSIILFSIISTILLFDKMRVYDFIINALLVYVLFIKKVNR